MPTKYPRDPSNESKAHGVDTLGYPLVFDYRFFDCECDQNYQHHKDTEPACPVCKCHHDDCPDSRVHELIINGLLEGEV